MNYCVKCGTKLKKDSKFCSKCGTKIKMNIEKRKEEKKEKLLLSIGTLLIIVASVIFAIANWNEMTSILKVLFLAIESLLFLSLSLFSKRLDYKMPYKFLWFLGIIFIPLILHLIAYEKMLGDYLSYEGNGLYVYLSISSFICTIIYFLSHRFLKSNVFLIISYLFIYFMIISIFGIFKLDKFEYMIPILNGFNLLVCIFYSFIKNKNYNSTINVFMSIMLFIFSFLTLIYTTINANIILQIITYLGILVSLVLIIFKSKKNIMQYIYPFIINVIVIAAVNTIFETYPNIVLFLSILCVILFYIIINLKNNDILKNITYILMLIFILFILLVFNVSYLTLFINSIILLITLLFIIKINITKVQTNISKILLPIIIFISIYTLSKAFTKIDLSIIYLIVSIICFTVFVIFNHKKKDSFTKSVFEVYSYTYLIISTLIILITKPLLISFILNEVLWIYYFIFNKAIKRNKYLNIWLLIMLILNFILLNIRYSISFYYSLLFISLISLILYFVEIKFNNKKTIFIYFGIITTTLASLTNLNFVSTFGIGLLVISYVFSYYLYNKFHNTNFVIKFIYTLVGFTIINSVFNYFIDNALLVNLLVFITYLIIIISMFLLRVDSDRKVLCYSLVTLFPYVEIVKNADFLQKYSTSLYALISVILIIIYFEKVFSLKEKEKTIFELIILSIIHVVCIMNMLIFNFIFAAFYIFYGFYKKRESFTIFGTILLILALIINVFRIANNITVTYVLLFIGVIMLTYVFYMEARKKKNNKK